MHIRKKRITKNIFLVHFDSQKDMALTFLRFQEHYESPKFAGKIFSHEEFKEWYTSIKGAFTYHEDWNGFNIPSHVLGLFYAGEFDPLSVKEEKLLELFETEKHNFYIIAVHGSAHYQVLKHELAHALFYTEQDYKKRILKTMRNYNLDHIREELLTMGGYHRNVLTDEIQAYTVSLSHELKGEIPEKMRLEVDKIFSEYCPLHFHI